MDTEREWLTLDGGETVVWEGRPRMRRILPQVGTSLAWLVVFAVVAVVGPRFAPAAIPPVAVTGGAVLLASLSAWPAVRAYLETRNVEYVLTDRNVYEKHGVVSTNVVRVGVENVQNTELSKDVWGTLFDYGTVSVSTAGSRGSEVTFSDLNDPETFRDELRTVTRRSRSAEAEAAAVAGALDAGTADALLDDARAMRETADRLATAVIDG